MRTIFPAVIAAFVVAGCASRNVPVETVDAGPYLRDARTIERGLEKRNKRDFACVVRTDSLIVCDGIRYRAE